MAVGIGIFADGLRLLLLGAGCGRRSGLRSRSGRQGGSTICAEVVEEGAECRGGEEHAGEIGQTGVFGFESFIFSPEVVGFFSFGGEFAFELTNVFCSCTS